MKEIKLSKGYFALVDDDDYDRLIKFSWHIRASKISNKNNIYAVTDLNRLDKSKRRMIFMHRVIMNIDDPNIIIDHKDMNGLNNQKLNLRTANKSQNGANRTSMGSSEYLGVSWCKHGKKWLASISFEKKCYKLGRFHSEIDAAKAYDTAAKDFHKEFANVNFKTITDL